MKRHAHRCALLLLAVVLGPLWAGKAAAQQPPPKDKPIDLGGQGADQLTGDDAAPLQVTGFLVGNYRYAGRTGTNGFDASKVAVSLFREVNDRVWLFGQLTTSLNPPETPGEEPATETEIDNLMVNVLIPGTSSFSASFGKFDVPLGFERDDEPLNLQASQTFNYELGRPAKLVGLIGRWNAAPSVEVLGMLANGWDAELDPNQGKTVGAHLGLMPSEHFSLGLGGLYGPEGDTGAEADRYLLTADYALQPSASWLLAGEANVGGDRGVGGAANQTWLGGTVTLFHRLSRYLGLVARAESFNDKDGSRTGQPQVLTSYTLAPIYFLGVGREGIFANVEHTTLRIPRFQVRAEARLNHSTVPFFDTSAGLDQWNVQYVVQLVTTF